MVIIGAGWIGLEVAAAARGRRGRDGGRGRAQALGRVLGDEVADVFADLHREHGVDLRLATGVSGSAPMRSSTSDAATCSLPRPSWWESAQVRGPDSPRAAG